MLPPLTTAAVHPSRPHAPASHDALACRYAQPDVHPETVVRTHPERDCLAPGPTQPEGRAPHPGAPTPMRSTHSYLKTTTLPGPSGIRWQSEAGA
jgi:hypothetical protein